MLKLINDNLEVHLGEPGELYRRCRFDWTGICVQVLHEGVAYCSREAFENHPGSEGLGLSHEFGIQTPIGFDRAEPGDWFPKLGVGMLQRTDREPYSFMRDLPLQPADNSVEIVDQGMGALFCQTMTHAAGWGWVLERRLRIEQATLHIDAMLRNTGEYPLVTEEYNHNFLGIGGCDIDAAYTFSLPFVPHPDKLQGEIETHAVGFVVTAVPANSFYVCEDLTQLRDNVVWHLTHDKLGRGVTCIERYPMHRYAIWGMRHVISPECFVHIDVAPGQTQAWGRSYTFL